MRPRSAAVPNIEIWTTQRVKSRFDIADLSMSHALWRIVLLPAMGLSALAFSAAGQQPSLTLAIKLPQKAFN